jgi:transcriptional regulator with XRE-family HTH domain
MTRNGRQPVPQTLTDMRHAAELSLSQVAERMGIGKHRVSHIEARYPNLNYDTVTRYMQAIGARVQFVMGDTRIEASEITADPDKAATREYLGSRPGKGNLIYRPSSAEELPLQGDQAQATGDDSGREVDETDPQGDQSDGAQRQQP